MVGNSNSGRKKEIKTTATPYRGTSLSGKQFSSLLTNKPLNMPEVRENSTLEQTQAEVKKSVNERIESWGIMKKAEVSGMPKELIDEMKMQLGLAKEEERSDQPMDQKDIMLMKMISEEEDPQMKQLYMMSLFGKGKNSMDPMTMTMFMNSNKKKDGDSFMEKLALKFLDQKTDNKSDIDRGMEFYEKIQKMNETMKPKDVLDEMMASKQRLIDLGIVQDPQGGIADRQLDLEFKKLELDHERRVTEMEAKVGGQEEIMKAATQGISALLGAIGHFAGKKNENTGPSQEERTKEQIQNGGGSKIMANCSNPSCNTQFPVVTDKDRSIACPNDKCNFTYLIKGGEFFLSEESAKKLDASSSNEPEVKLE